MGNPTPKQAVDVDVTYREVRNKLRQYSLHSILDAALILLNRKLNSLGDEVQSAPWLILLMVKWALQDKMVNENLGRRITPNEFIAIQQRLWNMERGNGGPMTTNIFRFIRSLSYVQVQFQRGETFEFARWPAILSRLSPQHALRKQFEAEFGLTPDDFLDLTLAVYGPVVNREGPLAPAYFTALRARYGEKIDTILGLFSRDVPSLREQLSAEAVKNRHSTQAVLEIPVFSRFPLVRGLNGLYHCWHRKVFARGVEEFIHNKLSLGGQPYSRSYSEIFEDYVVDLAKGTGLLRIDEKGYWRLVGKDKHAVEAILRDEDCNIFVEAKFGLYQDEYITLDDPEQAWRNLKRFREAAEKGAAVSDRLASVPELQDLADRRQDFLLIVTNRQLYIPTGRQVEEISSERTQVVDERARLVMSAKLPVENVFILSLDEFERLMTAVTDKRIRLSEILPKLAELVTDPAHWRMDFGQMMGEFGGMRGFAPLIEQAIEASMARLAAALGQPLNQVPLPWDAAKFVEKASE